MKSWKEMKLMTAKALMAIEEADDELDMIVRQLALLEGKKKSEIENMTPEDLFAKWGEYAWTGNLPKAKLTKTIKHNGKEYGMTELNKLTLAQMIDIEELYAEGIVQNIEKIASVLLLPVKKKSVFGKVELEEYEYDEERAKEVLEMDMEFIWGNTLFFWTGVSRYTEGLRDYLVEMTEATTPRQKRSSVELLKSLEEWIKAGGLYRMPVLSAKRQSERSGAGSE